MLDFGATFGKKLFSCTLFFSAQDKIKEKQGDHNEKKRKAKREKKIAHDLKKYQRQIGSEVGKRNLVHYIGIAKFLGGGGLKLSCVWRVGPQMV